MNSFFISDALARLTAQNINHKFYGDESVEIRSASVIQSLGLGQVGFFRGSDVSQIASVINENNLVLLGPHAINIPENANVIITYNPSLSFNVIGWMLKDKKAPVIHETAIVGDKVSMGNNSSIGAHAVIEDSVEIGDNCKIMESSVLKNCTVGDNSIIKSGVKIGNSGAGSYLTEEGEYIDFPHFGKVMIGKNVVIHDNTIINRGTLGDTTIGDNVRIGPLTWIAHGVEIGESTFIAQSVTIAGSVKVGDFAKIWGNVSIRDGVSLGSYSTIGMGAAVINDIPDHETWAGVPAKKI
jgi:UDP-3-O-[3-hydroxymyristoyl] glucosamine N-acyltransferase